MRFPAQPPEPAIVERATGVTGGELVLRRVGDHYEIISNGVFLMDTRDGSSERALVRASLAVLPPDRVDLTVLVGGLGVGFSAAEALACDRVAHVQVVELEPQVIAWHSGPLGAVAGHLPEEPRCRITRADLVEWLSAAEGSFDAICLDIDNGPDWTVVESNGLLYEPAALDRLAAITAPQGVVAFWSAMPAPGFARLLRERFGAVEAIEVPAPRGTPDLVYLARSED
ncbi:spermidine synthase [Nocardiopsis ansamitocini]|uniref:Spermidine synthase n=1 Tax=Nocardiopsis ansamitocini TaxID=1670832 RepID=A0A9W6UIP4_9ACTN|nr:spermidine synthase [Nocardiopsis ansamitocini]GLU47255.1 spermidine synthase [Nocardiopsis ansamitocini]